MHQNKGIKFLFLLCSTLFVSLNTYSQDFSLGICYDLSQDRLCDYGSSSDFEQDSNGSLRPGSYGSTGMNAADLANVHFQARNSVPQQVTNQVNHMNQIIQNDTSGKFDETKKKLFEDFTKLSNGIIDFEFLPPSMLPPPLPRALDNPAFKDELIDFYQQTKDNDFESTKNRVNQTIGKLSQSNPSADDTFWWNEVRRNHTDDNGILTSLPYQKLKSIPLSTPIQSTQGQYVRQELNNTLSNHAQTSYNYLKECQRTNTCGDKHSAIEPVQFSDARNRIMQKSLKVQDENEAWGYESGNLANYISEFNNQQNQFNKDFPNPTKEQLDSHNAESLFYLDKIDQEIKNHGQNVGTFISWPTHRSSNLKNLIEKTNQNSADAATCLAAFNLCQMSGDADQILSRPTIDIDDGTITPTLLKAFAKEKQILELLSIRKKIEGLTFSGVSGAKYLKDVSRFSLISSAAMALNGAMQESNKFKAIGQEVLDIGLGLIPGVSLGKDAYELFSGKNLVTGKPLTTADRVLAAVGLITLGTGDKLFKGAKLLGKGLKTFANSPAMKQAIKYSGHVVDSAKYVGLKTSEGIRDFADTTKRILGNEFGSVGNIPDVIKGRMTRFNPINHGPLHQIKEGAGTVADTFRSSSYFQTVTDAPIKLYRVYGGSAGEFSPYWSRVKPTGPGQATLDAALSPNFKNSALKWVEITVPKNTTIFEGVAAPQAIRSSNANIKIGELLGGGSQVYLKDIRVPITWKTDGGSF